MKSRLLCRRHFSLQSSCLTRFVHCIVCLFLCVFEPFSAGDIFTGQLFDNAVLKFVLVFGFFSTCTVQAMGGASSGRMSPAD